MDLGEFETVVKVHTQIIIINCKYILNTKSFVKVKIIERASRGIGILYFNNGSKLVTHLTSFYLIYSTGSSMSIVYLLYSWSQKVEVQVSKVK